MCYNEFIAYQCGHRSMGVVRPCPLTTAGHNFPVCGAPPDKPHYAETMCAACERQLHSRWVLIREWEHRWLHERGVCGCEVAFPGLLTTPRVIGDATPAADIAPVPSTPGAATPRTAIDDGEWSKPKAIAATGEDSADKEQQETAQGDARVPALFSEAVTETGERRVTVRLSSLYAAEWQADHRALHDAGKCNCKTTFTPFQPQISDNELTPEDRETLLRWREKEEAEEETEKPSSPDVAGQGDETMKRIADIEKAFGKFEVGDEPPKVKLPRLAKTTSPPTEPKAMETREQGQDWAQGQHSRQHHNQRFDNRRHGGVVSSPSPPTQPAHPLTPTRGQLVLASSIQAPYSPPSPNYPYPYHYPHPYQPGPAFSHHTIPAPGYHYPEHAHAYYNTHPHSHAHSHPHSLTPAYPPYATPATYTDTIPQGAHPWTAAPQPTTANSNMPWIAHGPGPYRTPGFAYPATAAGAGPATPSHDHHGEGKYHHLLLPPPAITSTGVDQHGDSIEEQSKGERLDKGKGKTEESRSPKDKGKETTSPLPLCGVPIGAGPEGTSHLPPWGECPLRRDLGALALTMGEAESGGAEGHAGEKTPVVMGGLETSVEETGAESNELQIQSEGEAEFGVARTDGADGDASDGGRRLFPPTPPRRRHSAAT
ncbi:hypothetical protein C8A05DRAFT_13507 [Staphylotrichum tortipilum]|uniref:Uncharacterized protein n=1 Tax=Staphylotrichum tortipilum TaxID=2831512 RepID=A0AAN6MPT1_9PEZI|nr:hypothetical protein C8A05DRAFT_13507 [Staphylotrichum longicolle]